MAGTKVAIFAFRGETVCFAHALLHSLDLDEKGHEVKLIVEGTATSQVQELCDPNLPFAELYARVKEKGLLEGVCKACSAKTGSLQSAQEQGLRILADMSGHPSVSRYLENGYSIITL